MADVANTWPLDPTPSTMIEAMTTIKSVRKRDGDRQSKRNKQENQIRVVITSVSMKPYTNVKPYIACII